ncbi:MAG TPA: isocitrate lyase/phosphoenolpyruvate mutase family protein [Stellaceae bacterium]|nr:isocitrate lyase/phosphoenolpyruvate mutase family protein [Stellaceae bacterium]
MGKNDQKKLAEAFRRMHHGPHLLLLPNAWDAMSARIFAAAGFEAIATTSGGVAWALGYPDGEQAPWREVAAATARIAGCVDVPVTADIETGYGETSGQVAENVAEIIAAGAVGINLEDGLHGAATPIRDIADAAERIRAARDAASRAGVPIVINARSDLYLRKIGDDASRFAETVRRAEAYAAAGADCFYPFGLRDPATIAALAKAVPLPLNVTGRAGMPGAAELEALGVRRVTIASAPTLMVLSLLRQIAEDLRRTGRFDGLDPALKHPDAQRLFERDARQVTRPRP